MNKKMALYSNPTEEPRFTVKKTFYSLKNTFPLQITFVQWERLFMELYTMTKTHLRIFIFKN